MKRQPLIGISGSVNTEESQYFINRDYMRSLTEAGAVPLLLAPDMTEEQARQCARALDGLLLAGGNDVSPRCFGQEPVLGLGEVNPLRDQNELRLIELFRKENKPIFGICRGVQILNVALGGTLIQDLPSQHRREDGQPSIDHRQTALGAYASHRVVVAEGSLLEQILGQQELWVNSFHHQAVGEVAGQANLSAWAADGVVEAIELPDAPFVLGVQWHPEKMTQAGDEASRQLFAAFAEAARR